MESSNWQPSKTEYLYEQLVEKGNVWCYMCQEVIERKEVDLSKAWEENKGLVVGHCDAHK